MSGYPSRAFGQARALPETEISICIYESASFFELGPMFKSTMASKGSNRGSVPDRGVSLRPSSVPFTCPPCAVGK